MRWMTRGDVDGFFGLALDNLVQLLVIDALCRHVLGFSNELVYGRVLPGAAVSLLVGNLFYSWQAMQLARRSGRTDVCALPYGINTVSLFAYVFLVMLPAKLAAEAAGAADPAYVAWQAGSSPASAPASSSSAARSSPSASASRRRARRCSRPSPASPTPSSRSASSSAPTPARSSASRRSAS